MKKRELPKINGSKIMLLTTTDNMITQFLIPHIRDLQSYGAQVDLVCSRTGFWFDDLVNMGFNVIEVNMERNPINRTNSKAFKKLCEIQKQNKYDLIYCQQPVGGLMGRRLAKKFNIPVIYTVHGFFFMKGKNCIKNAIFHTAEKIMSKYTDVLITMNDEDYNASIKWKVPYKYKISGIGMDVGKYDNSEFDKVAFKKSLGLDENDIVILSVSEFIKRKNYKTMIETFSKLAQKHNNLKYVLCGTGVLLEEMKQYAKKLGVEDKTFFVGYRKDINKIMQISDIFFHQSFQEGLTMSIMEALYFGLPVVTSNVRGNVDLVDNGRGGIITKCKDVKGQMSALEKLILNKDLRERMSEYNKEKVKAYLLDNVRTELKNIYHEIGCM